MKINYISLFFRRCKNVVLDIFIDIINLIFFRQSLKGKFIDKKQTIESFVMSNKSFLRWGDGESLAYFGSDIWFQQNSSELNTILKKIISSQKVNKQDNYLFAMTHEKFSGSIKEILSSGPQEYNTWKSSRFLYATICDKKRKCFNAYMFKGLEKTEYDTIVKKFLSFKNIVVVCSNPDIAKDFFSFHTFNGKVFFIKIPETDAFSSFDDVKASIKKRINNPFQLSESVILISAGPLAKCVCYELSSEGYIVYDIGKFFATEFQRFKNQN